MERNEIFLNLWQAYLKRMREQEAKDSRSEKFAAELEGLISMLQTIRLDSWEFTQERKDLNKIIKTLPIKTMLNGQYCKLICVMTENKWWVAWVENFEKF